MNSGSRIKMIIIQHLEYNEQSVMYIFNNILFNFVQ